MPILQQLGMQAASEAVHGLMGIALGGVNDKRQVRQQRRMNNVNMEYNKEMTEYNQMKQMEMWHATGYEAQKKQMKEAGINPALLYGMGGGGGQSNTVTTSNQGASQAPSGGGEIQGMMGIGIQGALLMAQKQNIEADTAKKIAETQKTAGVDTENVKADTENKILAKVIQEFTGKEMKDTYERISSPNRGIQAKTYQEELEARQGMAGTIYELWVEGKLKDKSVAEIEKILLDNSKSRAETANIYRQGQILEENLKGAKLDNVIKKLEMELQTQTGIDRNSPAWMKMVGRLFVQLMGQ